LDALVRGALSTGAVQFTFDSGMPMTTIVDSFDRDLPPDDDANYTCDLCDQVHREGLDRIVTVWEIDRPRRGGRGGTLRMVSVPESSLTELLDEKVDGPRVIIIAYVCNGCVDELSTMMPDTSGIN
jgi:hypothetical protein